MSYVLLFTQIERERDKTIRKRNKYLYFLPETKSSFTNRKGK